MCHSLLTIFPYKYSRAAVSLFDVDDKIECPLIVFVISEASIQDHFSCVVPNWKTGVFYILVPVGCVIIGIIGMLLASYITSRDSASQTLPFLLIGLRSNSTVNFYSPMRPYFVRGMRNEEKFESLSTLQNYLKINEYARTPVTDWINGLTVTSDKISFQQKPFCPLMAISASRIGDHDKPAVRRQNFIRGEPPSCRKVPIPMHYIYA